VVVAVERATTCGTDLKAYRQGHPFIPMPGPFGHQYCGRIEAVGAGVRAFEPGQPILGVHSGPCGECRPCRRGRTNLCERFREQLVLGAFAERLRITERVVRRNLHPRPAEVSAVRGAFLEPVSCIVHALRGLDLRGVDRVLVLGLGSMGLLFLQLLPYFTGAEVVAAGRRPERLAMAAARPAAEVWDVEAQPLRDRLGGRPAFDCVVECTGRPEGWRDAFEAALPGGVVTLFGGLRKGESFSVDAYRLHYEELRLHGFFHFTPDDVLRSVELLSDPGMDVESMVAGEVPLEGLEEALLAMDAGGAVKFAVAPESRGP
jgi:L-iditol 2-dehydrogenase